ncbi:unnamed protein product, partial [Boreogadus saida]
MLGVQAQDGFVSVSSSPDDTLWTFPPLPMQPSLPCSSRHVQARLTRQHRQVRETSEETPVRERRTFNSPHLGSKENKASVHDSPFLLPSCTPGHIKFSGRMQIAAINSIRRCKVMTRWQDRPVRQGAGHG